MINLSPFGNPSELDALASCSSILSYSSLDSGMPLQALQSEFWLHLRYFLLAHCQDTNSHYSPERA